MIDAVKAEQSQEGPNLAGDVQKFQLFWGGKKGYLEKFKLPKSYIF